MLAGTMGAFAAAEWLLEEAVGQIAELLGSLPSTVAHWLLVLWAPALCALVIPIQGSQFLPAHPALSTSWSMFAPQQTRVLNAALWPTTLCAHLPTSSFISNSTSCVLDAHGGQPLRMQCAHHVFGLASQAAAMDCPRLALGTLGAVEDVLAGTRSTTQPSAFTLSTLASPPAFSLSSLTFQMHK